MAITNAQQYQQLVNPPMKGNKRPGYRGSDMAGVAGDSRAANTGAKDTSGADYGGGNQGMDRSGPERDTGLERARQRNIETLKTFKEKRPKVEIPNLGLSGVFLNLFNKGVNSPIQKFADFTASKNRPFFEDVIRAGKIPGLNFGTVSNMTEEELEEAYQNYNTARLSGDIDAYGNPIGGGNDDKIILPQTMMAQAPSDMDQEPEQENSEGEGLFRRFRAEGGIMNTDVIGGEIDFESARQMYGLGGGAFFGKTLPGVGTGGGFSFRNILPNLMGVKETGGVGQGFEGILGKIGLTKGGGSLMPTIGGGITAASAIAGMLTPEQEEEAQNIADETGIDIAEIRANPNKYLARRFKAEGGSMDEPVAKKTMPLLDMGGKEMELSAEGGFVPIGRMEKADDVPARLSKNEFVFTADAVRNAGEGDVDKGAEVMYNMMKNLESGGDVSEESQGLDGARKMFQTSQRLEEVL